MSGKLVFRKCSDVIYIPMRLTLCTDISVNVKFIPLHFKLGCSTINTYSNRPYIPFTGLKSETTALYLLVRTSAIEPIVVPKQLQIFKLFSCYSKPFLPYVSLFPAFQHVHFIIKKNNLQMFKNSHRPRKKLSCH